MSDTADQHDQFLILHFVRHAIVTNPNTAQPRKLALQHTARSRVCSDLIDGGDNANLIFPPEGLKLDDSELHFTESWGILHTT